MVCPLNFEHCRLQVCERQERALIEGNDAEEWAGRPVIRVDIG
jgi:hypothetical protein